VGGSVYPPCTPSSVVTNASLSGIANDTAINDDPILLPNTVLDDQTATIIGCNSPPSLSSSICTPNSNPLEAIGGTTSFYVLGGTSGSGGP